MRRIARVRRDRVDVDVEERRVLRLEMDETGLLFDLPSEGGLEAGIARIDVTARLKPAIESAVMNQHHGRTRWVRYEPADREVPGLEPRSGGDVTGTIGEIPHLGEVGSFSRTWFIPSEDRSQLRA
jgi:hypothetical protein